MAATVAPQQLQCLACNGIYQPVQADGLAYFHACAPVGIDPQLRPVERPNKRDENVTVDRAGNLSGIKSAGAGVKPAAGSTLDAHPGLDQILKAVPEDDEE